MYKENLGFSQPEKLDFAIIISVVLVTQSCLTLHDCMDYSLADSSVHGNLQARILEWVTVLSSKVRKWIQRRCFF